MRYAHISNGLVDNVQLIDTDPGDPAFIDLTGITCSDGSDVAIGDGYSNGVFTSNKPGPSPIPAGEQISALWSGADTYQSAQISGAAIGLLTLGVERYFKDQSCPKSAAVMQWIQAVWKDYYARKDLVVDGATVMPNLDFSNNGAMPYTVPDLMAELGV